VKRRHRTWRLPIAGGLVEEDPSELRVQSYFTTGGLPPISSSCRRAPSDPRQEFNFLTEQLRLSPSCNILSGERILQLLLVLASAVILTVSDSRLPQHGWPVYRIYIPPKHVTPGTGFPFRRRLRLAGLRCRYLVG
jgi:hypothetical protein